MSEQNVNIQNGQTSDIIVVSGLPRSGTSLMMRMLEAGGIPPVTDGHRQADPDNPLGYYELEAVKRTRSDPTWLDGARGKAVKVIHLLLLDLPPTHQYRVIFMQRAMAEVLASQRKMLERAGRSGGGLSAEALSRQYEAQLRQVDAFIAARSNFVRLDVDYNALLACPGPIVQQVARFVGLAGQEATMAAAIDPSLYRNRRG